MLIYIRVPDEKNPVTGPTRYFKATVTLSWLKRNNNYAMRSCGYTVGDDMTRAQFSRMRKIEVTQDEWNHSGCQSSCIRRGDKECRW